MVPATPFLKSLVLRVFFGGIHGDILAEYKLKHRAYKRLNEKQLSEKCKREIKAYELQPIRQ